MIQMRGKASLGGSRNPGATMEWAEDTELAIEGQPDQFAPSEVTLCRCPNTHSWEFLNRKAGC